MRLANKNLSAARTAKNDEFYTQLSDVEKELKHYKDHFEGAVVYCNCDDVSSSFWQYFHLQFSKLGLKKLVATHYDDSKPTYKMEYCGGNDNDVAAGTKTLLTQNGDFRSEESISLLEECDVVVTNPPFSLFREYLGQLVEYDKKFIIWSNNNAITYKEVFPLLKNNKVWLGYTANKTCSFRIPDDYEKWDEKVTKEKSDGYHYATVPAISVFTNLDIKKRHEELVLWKEYDPAEYPKYDNYDAINVDKVTEIPDEYFDILGVPITFMDKFCPEQFEIIDLGNSRDNFTPTKDYKNPKKHTKDGGCVNGGAINCVLAIEVSNKPVDIVYYTSDNSKYLVPPYARILIRKKAVKDE